MYRIEIAPGEVAVFRTIEELATGIRNGLITPRARIFHAASDKWLPIDFHPHYKKALGLVTGGAPLIDTSAPGSPPGRPRPVPSVPAAATPLPPVRQAAPEPPPAPAPVPAPTRAPAPPPPPARATWPPPAPSPAAPIPAATAPPVMPPPVMQPPAVQPPMTRSPMVHPPVTQSPIMQPPVIQPPATQPPPIQAPATPSRAEMTLPRITYPEVPALEPEVHHPVARRRRTARAPLAIVGAILLALAGSYYVSTAEAPPSDAASDAASEPAAEPSVAPAERDSIVDAPPLDLVPEDIPPAVQPAVAQRPLDFSAPRPAGPVSQAWSSSAGALAPVVKPAPARPTAPPPSPAPGVAPPPARVDLTLPALPPESLGLSSSPQRDSAAIKRILRAVSGESAPPKPKQ